MSKISDLIWKIAKPVVESKGLELWDVEYVKEAGQFYLRVYIDKVGGVAISDCEDVSRELDDILDETDPIPDSYIFEVSSAGAERELKRPSDFERFTGARVEVRLYKGFEGKKAFVGTLLKFEDGAVTIDADEREITFLKDQVAKVRLHI